MKKIKIKYQGTTIKVSERRVLELVLASLTGHSAAVDVPALGEYWPNEGGHNAGFVQAHDDVPAHYLIVAGKDIGNHEWGGQGKESTATSKTDGLLNTQILLSEGGHPAAEVASKYSADGHSDFYLPAAAENYRCWLSVPELFAKDCWHWSSSQRSAYGAFGVYFDGGNQYDGGKGSEFRVRPVRSELID